MATRTQDRDPAQLAPLFEEGGVVRTHVMRTTWHFVPAEDVGWLLELTGPRLRRITGQQLAPRWSRSWTSEVSSAAGRCR